MMMRIKGRTSRELLDEYKGMKKAFWGQHLWARGYFELLCRLVSGGRIVGGLIHDARVAALCLHHGVTVLWSSDRNFSRFPELSTFNPLLSK